MSASPYKTFLQALGASAYMAGVSLQFGEELVAGQEFPLPCVVMVPVGGDAVEPGFARTTDGTNAITDIDFDTESLWEFSERFDFYLWHAAADPLAKAIDHAEATRSVRLLLLSALRDQLDMLDVNGKPYRGLAFKVLSSRWQTMQEAQSRMGRALILSVQVAIPEVMDVPASGEGTVETTEFDPSFTAVGG